MPPRPIKLSILKPVLPRTVMSLRREKVPVRLPSLNPLPISSLRQKHSKNARFIRTQRLQPVQLGNTPLGILQFLLGDNKGSAQDSIPLKRSTGLVQQTLKPLQSSLITLSVDIMLNQAIHQRRGVLCNSNPLKQNMHRKTRRLLSHLAQALIKFLENEFLFIGFGELSPTIKNPLGRAQPLVFLQKLHERSPPQIYLGHIAGGLLCQAHCLVRTLQRPPKQAHQLQEATIVTHPGVLQINLK